MKEHTSALTWRWFAVPFSHLFDNKMREDWLGSTMEGW